MFSFCEPPVSQIKERERAKLPRHASSKAIFHQSHQSAESFKAGQWKKEMSMYTLHSRASRESRHQFLPFSAALSPLGLFP